MVNYQATQLDNIFEALANPQRREMLARLSKKSQTISDLASPLEMSLPAIHKHVKVLEKAHLIVRRKVGRQNELSLQADALTEAQAWLAKHRDYWTEQLDALEAQINQLNKEQSNNG